MKGPATKETEIEITVRVLHPQKILNTVIIFSEYVGNRKSHIILPEGV